MLKFDNSRGKAQTLTWAESRGGIQPVRTDSGELVAAILIGLPNW